MVGAWFAELEPPPDVFAVVMATGIVSIAAGDHRYFGIGIALAVLAVLAFVVLGLGFLLRVARQPARALAPTRDPDVALRMFTFVAACTVLGVRLRAYPVVEWLLAALALAGWLVLMPLAVFDVGSRPRADLRAHAHGAWLLPSVATAGLAATAANLSAGLATPWLLVTGAAVWILGVLLYLAVTALIAWRALAAPFVPREVTPDSWILMGALAITALAGDRVLAAERVLGWPTSLQEVSVVLTYGAWVLAGLWIPVLLYAEVWRTDQVPGSLRYQGVWWSAVFPLGMYSTASYATATELHMHSLITISLVIFWIAFTVWILVALGLLHSAVARRTSTGRVSS
ncbi:MAG: tellurite resistance/C4-dicarboxylate transporter family protein [Trebonia sp.]